LGQSICTVCCGTKRLVEIRCPSTCVYLASAREHPAAVVRRRQEQDVARLIPSIQGLTERQYQLFFLLQSVITRHTPEGFVRLTDADVADAAGALASTLETAARGVIYEHAPASAPAQSLLTALKILLDELEKKRVAIYDAEVAIVLRAIERGARTVARPGEGDREYLDLLRRLVDATAGPASAEEPAAAPSPLILP
jgi:hypothetical protein